MRNEKKSIIYSLNPSSSTERKVAGTTFLTIFLEQTSILKFSFPFRIHLRKKSSLDFKVLRSDWPFKTLAHYSTVIYPFKMKFGGNFTISELKMMMKSGL